jgi:hypothetical protein
MNWFVFHWKRAFSLKDESFRDEMRSVWSFLIVVWSINLVAILATVLFCIVMGFLAWLLTT